MKIITRTISCFDEDIILTNQRAIFWEQKGMLILSDLHIGKTAHFRKNGIPIPAEILIYDLLRLSNLIKFFDVKTIMIVGDLFHAEANNDLLLFKEWMSSYNVINFILVKGNHDRINKKISQLFNNIEMTHDFNAPPFQFVHHPKDKNDNTFIISGHMHPGVMIKGKGKQRIKLPCYQVNNNQLILPAFSLFTGLNTNKLSEDYINYAFTDDGVFKVINNKIV